jgi:hypothetical protein
MNLSCLIVEEFKSSILILVCPSSHNTNRVQSEPACDAPSTGPSLNQNPYTKARNMDIRRDWKTDLL